MASASALDVIFDSTFTFMSDPKKSHRGGVVAGGAAGAKNATRTHCSSCNHPFPVNSANGAHILMKCKDDHERRCRSSLAVHLDGGDRRDDGMLLRCAAYAEGDDGSPAPDAADMGDDADNDADFSPPGAGFQENAEKLLGFNLSDDEENPDSSDDEGGHQGGGAGPVDQNQHVPNNHAAAPAVGDADVFVFGSFDPLNPPANFYDAEGMYHIFIRGRGPGAVDQIQQKFPKRTSRQKDLDPRTNYLILQETMSLHSALKNVSAAVSQQVTNSIDRIISYTLHGHDDGKSRVWALRRIQRFIKTHVTPRIRWATESVVFKGKTFSFQKVNIDDVVRIIALRAVELRQDGREDEMYGEKIDPKSEFWGGERSTEDFLQFERETCFDAKGERTGIVSLLRVFSDGFNVLRKKDCSASVTTITDSFRASLPGQGWTSIALVPKYPGVEYTDLNPDEKLELYHLIMAKVFDHPIYDRTNREKGIRIHYFDGSSDRFCFVIGHYLADLLEACQVEARKAYFLTDQKRILGICTCAGRNCANLDMTCELVVEADVRDLVARGTAESASFKNVENAMWTKSFLNMKSTLYKAIRYDPLHGVFLGLMKRLIKLWFNMLLPNELTYIRANADLIAEELNGRQSDRLFSFVKKSWPSLIDKSGELPRLSANEVPHFLFLSILAFGDQHTFCNENEVSPERKAKLLRGFKLYSDSVFFLWTIQRFLIHHEMSKIINTNYIKCGVLKLLQLDLLANPYRLVTLSFETTKLHALLHAARGVQDCGAGVGTTEFCESLIKMFTAVKDRGRKGAEYTQGAVKRITMNSIIQEEREQVERERIDRMKRQKLRVNGGGEDIAVKPVSYPLLSGTSIVVVITWGDDIVNTIATSVTKHAKKKPKKTTSFVRTTFKFLFDTDLSDASDKTNALVAKIKSELKTHCGQWGIINQIAMKTKEHSPGKTTRLNFSTCMHLGNDEEVGIFRADPLFYGRPWHDWIMLRWHGESVDIPARLDLMFREVTNDDSDSASTVYAIVHSLSSNNKNKLWNDFQMVEEYRDEARSYVHPIVIGSTVDENLANNVAIVVRASDRPDVYLRIMPMTQCLERALSFFGAEGPCADKYDEEWGQLKEMKQFAFNMDSDDKKAVAKLNAEIASMKQLTVVKLRDECESKKVSSKGRKKVMQQRLENILIEAATAPQIGGRKKQTKVESGSYQMDDDDSDNDDDGNGANESGREKGERDIDSDVAADDDDEARRTSDDEDNDSNDDLKKMLHKHARERKDLETRKEQATRTSSSRGRVGRGDAASAADADAAAAADDDDDDDDDE